MPPGDGNCVHRMVGDFCALDFDPGPASALYRLVIPALVLLPTWLLPGRRQRLSARSYLIIAIGGLFFPGSGVLQPSILETTPRMPSAWQ